MSITRPSSAARNSFWLYRYHVAVVSVLLGLASGLIRYIFLDWSDPLHCGALLNRGSWLDPSKKRWQPQGCMLYPYTPDEGVQCLASRRLVFIGDSIARNLFIQVARTLGSDLSTSPDVHKHSDNVLHTKNGTEISFLWDPFLNSSFTEETLLSNGVFEDTQKPALLVLGSGLWYLRYSNTSGGIPAWEANMDRIFKMLLDNPPPADNVFVLPVEQIVTAKLAPERIVTMHPSDVEAMNSDLFHRVYSTSDHSFYPWQSSTLTPVLLPTVFNDMLSPTLTDDGLHFAESLIQTQANILLNHRCNDVLPKRAPFNKTCCNRYPSPSLLQYLIIGVVILWGPCICYVAYKSGPHSIGLEKLLPSLIISSAVALMYIADRTGLWLKEQKQFNLWTFSILCITALFAGLATVKRGETDLGFLNREQTDEWKGWMQAVVLIYHYLGASKISGIYNPVRALVASYLFMTGYGHTTFYLRKADFGFMRIAHVLIRINLLTVLLVYTMNTDYISYYFVPLVSMWFLIIYVTLAVGPQLNNNVGYVICKILLSCGFSTWFMTATWPLEKLFDLLGLIFGIHWSAREWHFRVTLDLWIVYVGMLVALLITKAREHRVTEYRYWPLIVKVAIAASFVGIGWFFSFELSQESKFSYNLWHPYMSFIPVLSFVILRNCSVALRSSTSRLFSWFGRCSLESFIIQSHFWLAGDSKGVLLVLPGTNWRPINIILTTIIFIFLCDRVAHATGQITSYICDEPLSASPTVLPSNDVSRRIEQAMALPVASSQETEMHNDEEKVSPQSDSPMYSICFPHNIQNFHTNQLLHLDFKFKFIIALCIMWALNLLWTYS